ncbi:MAG: GNAT family N-acetyltransferase, partial [Vogesella sp.]|nr:GNAT family N-acetyltransferase [Vogesella sp.]
MTSAVTLRPLEPADADALFTLVDSSRDSLSQWLPWVDTTRSAADSLTFIQHTQAERDAGRVHTWLILADGQPAGVCDLHGVSLLNLHGSIGYWLADAYVGRGYLPQALAQVLHTAFAELGLNR